MVWGFSCARLTNNGWRGVDGDVVLDNETRVGSTRILIL